MSEQSLNEALSGRRVRITNDPQQPPTAFSVSVVDVRTSEPIPNVYRAVITIDVHDANKAEIFCYETDASGKLLVKDGDVVRSTVESNDPEVDITAFGVKPALEKHDGTLDEHDTIHVYYNNFDGIAISAGEPVWLTAKQALSLFAWLQQEQPTLERLVKTEGEA
jgi:hypothetical protein